MLVWYIAGSPPKQAAPAVVKVTVTDLNDNAPRFNNIQNGVIPAFVYENKDPNNSLPIVQVTAVDPDEGDNAKVSYSIIGGKLSFDYELVTVFRQPKWITFLLVLDVYRLYRFLSLHL